MASIQNNIFYLPIELLEIFFDTLYSQNIFNIISLAYVDTKLHRLISIYSKKRLIERKPDCKYAILINANEVVKWAVDLSFPLNNESCIVAAIKGNLIILSWFLNKRKDLWHMDIANKAALCGHMHIVEWILNTVKPSLLKKLGYDPTKKDAVNLLLKQEKSTEYNKYFWPLLEYNPMYNNKLLLLCGGYDNVVHNIILSERECQRPIRCVSLIDYAAQSGNLDLVRYLYKKKYHLTKNIYNHAALGGHIHILKWLKENNCEQDNSCLTYVCAMVNGNIQVLDWLKENNYPFKRRDDIFDYVSYIAAFKGDITLLEWANNNGFQWNSITLAGAVKTNNLELAKWLRKKGCEICQQSAIYAVINKNFIILNWLHENGLPKSNLTTASAITDNNFELLKQYVNDGYPLSDRACYYCATKGNLEMLKWLRIEQNCTWDEYVCIRAAELGDLNMLKWARENGCPWNNKVIECAERYGHKELKKWAIKNGCPK